MSRALLLRRRGIIALSGQAGTFSPTDVGGLQLWFDADAISGLADGDSVSQWDDLSGTDRHATQATSSRQPTYKAGIQNGRPIVRFDGGDAIQTAATQVVGADGTWSAFAVARRTGGSGVGSIVHHDNTRTVATYVRVAQMLRSNSGSLESIAFNSSVSAFTDSAGAHGSGFFVGSAVHSTTQIEAFVNGTSNGATSTSGTAEVDTTHVALGAAVDGGQGPTAFLTGDIAEVIIYDSALSSTDRASVESYLSAKWGV